MEQLYSWPIRQVFSGGGRVHYVLPHFQREYTWDREQWETLLNDVFAVYDQFSNTNSPGTPEHFLGSLVVLDDGHKGMVSVFNLVDGQQCLTTVSLLLCALDRAVGQTNPSLARDISGLLVNPHDDGDLFFKVLPTAKYGDRSAYAAIICDEATIPANQSKIPAAFKYLQGELQRRLDDGSIDPQKLFTVLTNCLLVVFIQLKNNAGAAFRIFESLNAKGKPLTQADLVRNYIAMRLPSEEQEAAFSQNWAVSRSVFRKSAWWGA